MRRTTARPALLLLVVTLAVGGSAAADVGHTLCKPVVTLQGAPSDHPAPPGTVMPPVRNDNDGARTVTLLVEDPNGPNDVGNYFYVPQAIPQQPPVPNIQETGVFWHPWSSSRPIVTYGIYVIDHTGLRTRIPLFLTENAPSQDLAVAATALALRESIPLLANATPYALNTVAPTPALAGLVPGLGPIWWMYLNEYPRADEYQNYPPFYIWTTYRTAAGSQLWSGGVLMHDGSFSSAPSGTTLVNREACRRTRIGAAVRDNAGTRYLGGVWISDHAKGKTTLTDNGTRTTFDAEQKITVGITVGTSPTWTDIPVATVRQQEHKQGGAPFYSYLYSEYQRDEITLGVHAGDTFVPLLGTRSEARHGPPHCDAGDPTHGGPCIGFLSQDHLVSLGAYDALGGYHPAVGARTFFEWWPKDLWAVPWALSLQGPGNQTAGDWRMDIGTFNPLGAGSFADFIPLAGVTYDDKVANALYHFQMQITAGVWTAGTYRPVLGLTYDGEDPLLTWALLNAGNQHAQMGKWLISAGTFSPLGPYVPLVGASYQPGNPATYNDARINKVEEYRVGVFTGSYPNFVPLAGFNFAGSQTSVSWATAYALAEARIPSYARIDGGAQTPLTGFVPVAGATFEPGSRDRYGIGAWALGGFVPLAEICHSRPGGGATVGVAARGGASRVPILWAGFSGSPTGGAFADCPPG